ncbi:MAG TPA: SDR family oxidoreductase [Actinoplanes sp.]|nr:SDR family oxidoreductase [Actinoplanes sp.]
MMRLLITGGHGYLGSVLAQKAVNRGHRVVVVDRVPAVPDPEAATPGVLTVVSDLRNAEDWRTVLRHVDVVVHLAAVVGDPACDADPETAWETNYLGTVRLAEECRRYGVRRLIFASTCSNYGASMGPVADTWSPLNPVSGYARSKILAEHHLLSVRGAHLRPTILRFATLHGLSSRMRFDLVVNRMTAAAVHEGAIEVHGGEQWRPFLHVHDAADAILSTLALSPADTVLNCGSSDQNYRILDVARLVQAEIPEATLIRTAGNDRRDYRVDFDPIYRQLGFRPKRDVPGSIREMAAALHEKRYPHYKSALFNNHEAVRTG